MAGPFPDPLALPLLRLVWEDTEGPLAAPQPVPSSAALLPGLWAGCPALSGRVAAAGSDTLGPALAVGEGPDCNFWEGRLHQHTWKGVTLMGKGRSSPGARTETPSTQSSWPEEPSSTGSPGV